MHRVTIAKERPDFRVFIDLLFRSNRNVDSEGNSNPVYSRTWSELYLTDRESDAPFVEITELNESPSKYEVASESVDPEELTALYLFIYSGRAIEVDNKPLEEPQNEFLKQKYSLQLLRAEASIWHKSSNENPYPNLA